MGILDGMLGGVIGSEMTAIVTGMIEKHGGLDGLVQHFEKSGLGSQVASWVGSGPNQTISADQLHQSLGSSTIDQLASNVGLTPQDLAGKLAMLLPKAIDALTPSGRLAQ